MNRIKAILSHVQGPSVLDVGCTGTWMGVDSPHHLHGQLRRRFADVHGIDINAKLIHSLEEYGFANLHVGSAEDFLLDSTFDTICAGELIEHLSNPGRFLDRATLHLKPSGRVVLTTPNVFALASVVYAILKYPKTCSNQEHTCWYCPTTLRQLAERHGFRVVHLELVADYPSTRGMFRWFTLALRGLKWVLPKRLYCNTILIVLEPDR